MSVHNRLVSLAHALPRLVQRGDKGLEVGEAGGGGYAALDAEGGLRGVKGPAKSKDA